MKRVCFKSKRTVSVCRETVFVSLLPGHQGFANFAFLPVLVSLALAGLVALAPGPPLLLEPREALLGVFSGLRLAEVVHDGTMQLLALEALAGQSGETSA